MEIGEIIMKITLEWHENTFCWTITIEHEAKMSEMCFNTLEKALEYLNTKSKGDLCP